MFGSGSFASAPFASVSDEITNYVSDATEAATATSTFAASVYYISSYLESASLSDVVEVTSVILNSVVAEAAAVVEEVAGQVDFASLYNEDASGLDSAEVAPSTFNATYANVVNASDTLSSISALQASIQESATAADNMNDLAPWEVIDDTQSASWQVENTAQTSTWAVIETDQTAGWQVIKAKT